MGRCPLVRGHVLFFMLLICTDWDLEHSPVRAGDSLTLYCYVRAKNVCLRLVCLHGAFPVFRHMNVDFCYQNCTVATNKSSSLLVKALEVVLKRRICVWFVTG